MNRSKTGLKTGRRRQELPQILAGDPFETEAGPQSYLDLLQREMAQEKMFRRASQNERTRFSLTLDA